MIANFPSCFMSHKAVSVTNHGGNLQRLISEVLQDSWSDLIKADPFIPMSDDEVVAMWGTKRPIKLTRREQDVRHEVEAAQKELFGVLNTEDVMNDPASWDFAQQA